MREMMQKRDSVGPGGRGGEVIDSEGSENRAM